jgi:hypothetical protein
VADTYLTLDLESGFARIKQSTDSGPAEAGRLVAVNASGVIDSSLISVSGGVGSGDAVSLRGTTIASGLAPASGQALVWDGTQWLASGITASGVASDVALSDSNPSDLGVVAAGTSDEASRADHVHAMPDASDVGAEPALGNPGVDGYVLSSTAAGVRSWVEMSGAGSGDATSIQGRDVVDTAPSDGQVLAWNDTASAWGPVTMSGVAASGSGGFSVVGSGLVPAKSAVSSFTPTFGGTSSNGSFSYSSNEGEWYILGDKVYFWLDIRATSKSSNPSSYLLIRCPGLPEPASNAECLIVPSYANFDYNGGHVEFWPTTNGSDTVIMPRAAGDGQYAVITNYQSDMGCTLAGWYRVDSGQFAEILTLDSPPTVTGSRGGNAALASLLTALENLGLIVDSTT